MPPRQQDDSTSRAESSNNANNNIEAKRHPTNGQQSCTELVSLRSLTLRNSIATFDPVRIYNVDQAADIRINEEGSTICAWLTGRSVLVSGASGFLGKALLEKLVRACEGLDRIFILVRAKGGKSTQERVNHILDDVVFKKLMRLQPNFKNKITGINGDISLPNLGILNEDRKMITDHVSVIFHVAATVNFDACLKVAVDVNVRGSAAMLQLGRECGAQLASYVHVSSTYANCTRANVDEVVYDSPVPPSELIALAEQVEDGATLEEAKIKLLGDYPNTYSFTKCVAEKIVEEQSEGMPICIFRPAIVVSTYREPVRGWTDNMYGPTGVFTGVGMGVIRTLNCDPDKLADMVPVDMVVNCMIAAAYNNNDTTRNGGKQLDYNEANGKIPVYNYVSSTQKPIRWSEICAFIQYYGLVTPTVQAMWYFCFRLNKYWIVNWLYLFFLHWIPAVLADGVCLCIGKEPKLTKLYRKVHKFLHVISYFSVKEWQFSNENVQKLWRGMNEADRAAFPFNMDQLDWDEHSQTHALGLRTYLLKEDLDTLPRARKRWNRLYYLHRSVQILVGCLIFKTIYNTLSFVYYKLF